MATMLALNLIVTAIRDQGIPEAFLIAYPGHYIAIAAVGIVVKKRLYDLVATWYMASTMAMWSFGVQGSLF